MAITVLKLVPQVEKRTLAFAAGVNVNHTSFVFEGQLLVAYPQLVGRGVVGLAVAIAVLNEVVEPRTISVAVKHSLLAGA